MARTERVIRKAQLYPSLADFYDADARRLDSREVDVGLWWRQDADGPLHRAAWVVQTGELYLAKLGGSSQGGGEVEVLARVDSRDNLEETLRGWQQRCGEPRSLIWLRQRASRLGERMRVVQRPGVGSRALAGPA